MPVPRSHAECGERHRRRFRKSAPDRLHEDGLETLNPLSRKVAASLVAERFEVSGYVWAHEPGPDGALMISAIATARTTFVGPDVIWICGREGAQATRSQ